jgi:DNA-binding transcriptional MerR regulator
LLAVVTEKTPDPVQPTLPDKLYFKIGEVSKIVGVPPYVLRFWEAEFKRIHPKRTPSGQRLYRRRDIELISAIKQLLYVDKYTIRGAKKHLRSAAADSRRPMPRSATEAIEEIRSELIRIREMLS